MERKTLFGAEDTDDLIQQQEEFLRSGKAPAAKVVRVKSEAKNNSNNTNNNHSEQTDNNTNTTGTSAETKNSTANTSKDPPVPVSTSHVLEKDVVRIGQLPQTTPDLSRQAVTVQKKKSLFKQSRDHDEDDDVAHRMRVGDKHISHVMTQIVERDHVLTPVTPPPPRSTAFPPVKHRSELNLTRVKPQPTRVGVTGVMSSTPPSSNDLLTEVDAENTAKLGNLSAAEISELQQEIFSAIDPKLVARLKQRGAARMNKTGNALPNLDKQETSNANTPMTRVNPHEVIDLANKGFVYDTRDTLTPVVSNTDQDEHLAAEQLEREKTQWMTPVTPDPSMTGVNARPEHWRYDFAGHRVTGASAEQYDPSLYHHGDQPELPGYTLQELFHLMSSTVKKQRALAVHVVANILQIWKQSADQSQAAQVLAWAIEHKLPLLVRRALDEGPEALVSDALRTLHALLVNARDAEIYDEMATTWHGACIWPLISEHVVGVTEDGEAEQLTDLEMSQRDVWTAVLQTGLLTRVRYVLEVMRPQSHVIVELILDLCLAAARHSETGVNHVLSCPRLLHVITRDLVHVNPSVTRDDTPYRPHPKALQLLQLCCQSSLDTCQRFLGLLPASPLLLNQEGEADPRADDEDLNKSAQGILPLVIAYFVRPPRDLSQHTSLSALTVQTLRLWHTCVRYGLASELFLDIYHVIIEHITHLQTKKEILARDSARVTTALFLVLEGLLDIAVVNSATTAEDSDINQGPALHWSHVSNLFQPSLLALDCLVTAVNSAEQDFASIREHVTAVAAIVHFLSSYFKHLKQLPEDHVTHVQVAVQQLSHVIAKYVAPLTQSKLFRTSMTHVTQLSNSDESRGSVWLQTLPCLTWSCQTSTSIAAQNTVLAVTRLLYMVMALIEDYNQLLDDEAKQALLFLDATLVQQFQRLLVALLDTHDRLPFMTKFGKALDKKTLPKLFTHLPSTRLAQSLVMLLNMVHRQQISTDLAFMKQLPSLAMRVVDQLLPGDELLVLEVFEHVILNRQVYLMTRDHVIEELSRRTEPHSVKSSFSEQHVIMSLLDQHRDSLVEFIDFYFGMVLNPYELPLDTHVTADTESRAFTLTRDFVTRGQLTHVIGLDRTVLPLNGTWLFWPLHYAHRSLNESEDSTEREQLLHEFVQHFVQQYIRVTCFLSIHNAQYFTQYPADVLFLELGRLFLLGPQICADPAVDSMAAHVIRKISARGDLNLDSAGPTTAAKLGDIAEIWLSEGAGGQALATWLLTALPAQCASQIWSTLATAWTTLTNHVTRPLHALVGDVTVTRVKNAMTWLTAPQVTEELRSSDLYWALVRHVTLGVFSEALGDEWSRQQLWSHWIKSQRPLSRVVQDTFYFWTEHEPVLSHTQLAEQPPSHVLSSRAAVLRRACEDDAELRAVLTEHLPNLYM